MRTVTTERTTHPVLIFWIVAGWIGFCLLPWYMLDDGLWSFEWLVDGYPFDEDYAPAAFLIVAAIILALCVYIAAFRERDGERLMPWSGGASHPRNLAIQLEAWWPLLKSTFLSMGKLVSLLWLPVLFGRGILYGGFTGATP